MTSYDYGGGDGGGVDRQRTIKEKSAITQWPGNEHDG